MDEWKIRCKNHKKLVGLRATNYSCFIDDGSAYKKTKVTKKCGMKRKINFKNYEKILEETQLGNKINYSEKNKIIKNS